MTAPTADKRDGYRPARLIQMAREVWGFISYSALRFYNDNCFQTAASLTYTSLLAIVPMMTIGFAIFSAFPAFSALQTRVQELIFRNLVPQIGDAILEYLGHFMANAGQMPIFGVIGLAVSAVLLIWTIEGSFAAIWRVKEPRSLVTRILSFWAIVSLTPLFAGASLSLSGSLWSALQLVHLEELADPVAGFAGVLPFFLQVIGCTLLYLVIPNRTVDLLDALCGGVFGSLMLEGSKALFAWYMREYPAYQTIYGALSTVPIFLFWLYIAWSTVLFGAVITAALPEWRAGRITRSGPEGLLPAQRLGLALAVLHELMDASRLGVGLRRRTIVGRVPVGAILIDGILEQLRDAHWVAHTTRDSWVITRDLGESTLFDLMKALGIGLRGSVKGLGGLELPWQERTSQILDAAEQNQQDMLGIPLKVLLSDEGVGEGAGVGESTGAGAGPVPLRPSRERRVQP
ncbi:YihY family inner membrane protein [Azospirillum sp.]|uniref:YihY family inner membrane protein n=1 Tax=Azospirillum sp. TaxID=34012 RepID=UPI002D407A76|nr:YihY family inner membrane protein [Azospirillum sp.]HYD68211.1 YihY family inner membrane protein [Azospirillum sp.]